MQLPQAQAVQDMEVHAESLLAKRDYKHALAFYERIVLSDPTRASGLLGAGECALSLGLGSRAMDLLGDSKTFNNPIDIERWVNLRSEAIRRFGRSDEGLAFVEEWMGRVGAEVQAKLMLRKAIFLLAQGDKGAAIEALKELWAEHPSRDPSFLVSVANVAMLTGNMDLTTKLGAAMARTRNAPAGFYLYLYGIFFGAHPFFVRLPLSLVMIALLLVPSLRPFGVTILFLLVVGAVISGTRRLVPLASSLALLAATLTGAFLLFVLAKINTFGPILGGLVLGVFVLGALVVAWRAWRQRLARRKIGG